MTNTLVELQTLKDFFKKIAPYFKKYPLFLVLGHAQSGKTTLIANSGFHFIPDKHFITSPTDEGQAFKRCQAWLTEKALWLDIPGHYLENQTLLSFLKKNLKKNPPRATLIVFDVTTLFLSNENIFHKNLERLKRSLFLLFPHIHSAGEIYLVLNKLDALVGFKEFFNDLPEEERRQRLGLDFPAHLSTSLATIFKKEFDALVTKLNQQILWRLAHQTQQDSMIYIQQFPLQFQLLKNGLVEILHYFSENFDSGINNHCKGIYFTSVMQQTSCLDFVRQTLLPHLKLDSPLPTANTLTTSKNYFTPNLFEKVALAGKTSSTQSWRRFLRDEDQEKNKAFLFLASGLFLLGTIWLSIDFYQNISHLRAAEADLTRYTFLASQLNNASIQDLTQILPLLNTLYDTTNQIQNISLPAFITHFYTPNLLLATQKAYQSALNHYLLPTLDALLQQPLTNTNNPSQLYGALKTYLMLGEAKHFNPVFAEHWLDQYFDQTLSPSSALNHSLKIHVKNLLNAPFSPLTLNPVTVATARSALLNASPALLMNAFIQNQNDTLLYTKNEFEKYNDAGMKGIIKTIQHGDWVLGSPVIFPSNFQIVLIAQLKTLYLNDYRYYWQTQLKAVQIPVWANWQEANQTLAAWNHSNSNIATLLENARENTEFLPQTLSVQLPTAAEWKDFLKTLYGLEKFTASMRDSRHPHEQAFLLAKSRFLGDVKNPLDEALSSTNHYPPLLQNWLKLMTDHLWTLTLIQTNQYLDQTWQTEVLPFYVKNIEGRYPLFVDSTQDIDLDDFTQFFGPKGILDNYYQSKLASFIDNQHITWQWKTLDDRSLNVNPNLLLALERSAIIRTMFFNSQDKLAFPFSLQLISMEPGLSSLQWIMGDQTFTDKRGDHEIHYFDWPNMNMEQLAMTFTDDHQQKQTTVENGPWALLRILGKNNLQPLDEGKLERFRATFDLNGDAAIYLLNTNKPINPLIPGIINAFRCPEKL